MFKKKFSRFIQLCLYTIRYICTEFYILSSFSMSLMVDVYIRTLRNITSNKTIFKRSVSTSVGTFKVCRKDKQSTLLSIKHRIKTRTKQHEKSSPLPPWECLCEIIMWFASVACFVGGCCGCIKVFFFIFH